MSCASGIAPLKLPWTNNTLNDNNSIIAPGIQVSVGANSQNLSLIPTLAWSNLWLNAVAVCGSLDNTTCVQEVGGVWQSSESVPQSSWNGSNAQPVDFNSSDTFFSDTLNFAGKRMDQFPMFSQQQMQGQQGRLPLSPNSTFISQLVETNLAPSKSFSLWVGDNSQSRSGSLIIGGYSQSFFQDPTNVINRTTSDCAGCLVVSRLTYRSPDGEIDLMSDVDGNVIQGKLEPSHPFITLPKPALKAFQNATGGTRSDINTLLEYPASNRPTGELVFTSVSGLTTVIPNNLLFGLAAFPKGENLTTDSSTVLGLVEPYSQNSPDFGPHPRNNIAILGIPFLSNVYIVRDYERDTISLGNIATNVAEDAEVTKICPLTPGSTFSPPPSDGTTGSSVPTAAPMNSPTSTHDHTGAIIGGVLGSVAGIALIFVIVFILMRRRKKLQVMPVELFSQDRSTLWSRVPSAGSAIHSNEATYNSRSDSSRTRVNSTPSDASKDPLVSPTYHELETPLDLNPNHTVWEKPAGKDGERTELPAYEARQELPT